MASDPHDRDDVYTACVEAALELGASVVPGLVKRAGEAMLQRAAMTSNLDERKWQVEASQFLSRHEQTLRAAYPEGLRREFAALHEEAAPRSKPFFDFESLELMGEEQVDETVELVRGQQIVLSHVGPELTQLNALISAARGDKVVTAAANPFRPEAWVRALRQSIFECGVPAWVRVRWMHHLSEALALELPAIYTQLCDFLRRYGVAAASFALNVAPAPEGSARGLPATVAAQGPAPETAPVVPVLNLRDLRRLLIGEARSTADGGDWAATTMAAPLVESRLTQDAGGETVNGGVTVPYAFEALQEMKQLDEAMQRMQQHRASGSFASGGSQDAMGVTAALTPVQVLSQEVVKLMVENIAGNEKMLPPIQQAVRQLEPVLLRLARHDPRFFKDKQHPTRQFLTEVTERSLAWPSADMPGFARFFEPLREAVEALASMPMDTAEPFEFALHTLEEVWREQEEGSRRERAKAARALIKAEKRNLIAQRIADSLKQRADVPAAAAEIRRFLMGPWSHVMAAAEMAEVAVTPDPGGYSAIISDLIWTTQPRQAAENRVRLARVVPPMLTTLRRGLASIEYPADETQHFLDYLADVHQAALRSQHSGPVPLDAVQTALPLAEEQEEPEVWLEPTEARDSGLMGLPASDTVSQFTIPHAQETDRPPLAGKAPRVREAERLQPGAWADMYIDNAWSRWRLAWASPHSLLFMFTDGAGKYKSMTRSVLDTMLAIGAMRTVSEKTVLGGALDAIAERALRNTLETVL